MTIEDVYFEWTKPFINEGVLVPPLKELELKRRCEGKIYYDKKLKTAIRRRKDIAKWVESMIDASESIQIGLEEAEYYRSKLGKNGREASLHVLWLNLRGYKR